MNARHPVTVITGASAGIGAELARVFARNGHELVLVARREERLNALADEIAATGKTRPHVMALDLQERGAADKLQARLLVQNLEPQYVVNNAGFGLVGAAIDLSRDEQLDMIDLNVRSLTEFSLTFVDSLARLRGGLLNVASIAAFTPGPGMAVYYATKAYVLSFSEALSRELARRGIRVTTLCPGPVKTEFAARAGAKGEMGPSALSVSAAEVAEQGYRGLMNNSRRVIPGFVSKAIVFLMGLVPRGLLLSVIDARQTQRRSARKT